MSLTSTKVVSRYPELGPCSDNDVLENLKDQGVIGVRNISVRRNGILRSTNIFVLTFNTPLLPKKIL